jgi:hypothetical protein
MSCDESVDCALLRKKKAKTMILTTRISALTNKSAVGPSAAEAA